MLPIRFCGIENDLYVPKLPGNAFCKLTNRVLLLGQERKRILDLHSRVECHPEEQDGQVWGVAELSERCSRAPDGQWCVFWQL